MPDLHTATADMHVFLQAWFRTFVGLAANDFYIAGESYGGSWVPFLAAHIHERQTSILASTVRDTTPAAVASPINLRGILLGNAQVSQSKQWKFFDVGCASEHPLFHGATCAAIQDADNRCEGLLRHCTAAGYDGVLCRPVLEHCRERSVNYIYAAGRNPYDMRQPCVDDGSSEDCYPILHTAEAFMNQPHVKHAFGVPATLRFAACNPQVPNDFERSGDLTREAEGHVTFLLNTVRLPCPGSPPSVLHEDHFS